MWNFRFSQLQVRRWWPFGIWHRVILLKETNVSEMCNCLHHQGDHCTDKAVPTSETSVYFYKTAQCCITKAITLKDFIYLFICNLFDDVFSVRQTIVPNIRIGEWWIIKKIVGSSCGLILRYYPSICLEGLRKSQNTYIRIAGLQANI
jgi:hypothetical protein